MAKFWILFLFVSSVSLEASPRVSPEKWLLARRTVQAEIKQHPAVVEMVWVMNKFREKTEGLAKSMIPAGKRKVSECQGLRGASDVEQAERERRLAGDFFEENAAPPLPPGPGPFELAYLEKSYELKRLYENLTTLFRIGLKTPTPSWSWSRRPRSLMGILFFTGAARITLLNLELPGNLISTPLASPFCSLQRSNPSLSPKKPARLKRPF